MSELFASRLINKIKEKDSRVVVGLDPQLDKLPDFLIKKYINKHGRGLKAYGGAYYQFCVDIIEAVKDYAVAVKPQMACFEELGAEGMKVLQEVSRLAHQSGLLVIADGKRNDIGHTASVYARTYLGRAHLYDKKRALYSFDALTVNPYLGSDGLIPFLKECRKNAKGIFVLVKTSNPSSADLQDLEVKNDSSSCEKGLVYERIAELINKLIEKELSENGAGYSAVGAVVGATYPETLGRLRRMLPRSIFLLPGYGAQGGGAEDILPAFENDSWGAVVNSSRGINYAFDRVPFREQFGPENYERAACEAAIKMRDDINKIL